MSYLPTFRASSTPNTYSAKIEQTTLATNSKLDEESKIIDIF